MGARWHGGKRAKKGTEFGKTDATEEAASE